MLSGRSIGLAAGTAPRANRVALELAARQLGAACVALESGPSHHSPTALRSEVGGLVDLLVLGMPSVAGNPPDPPHRPPPPELNLGSSTADLPEAISALRAMQGPGGNGWGRRRLVLAHALGAGAGTPAAARTLVEMAVTLGLGVTVHQPGSHTLPLDFLEAMTDRADLEGGLLTTTDDPSQALKKADAVYPWCDPETLQRGDVVDESWMDSVHNVRMLRDLHQEGIDPLAPFRIGVCKALLVHLLA